MNIITESECKYVSSRGILKSCNIHSSNPISSIRQCIGYDFSQLSKNNTTLYICNSAIPYFHKHILDKLPFSIILVSGDCDESCPVELFQSNTEFFHFIENPKIIRWFSQNCVASHSKLEPIPIGLDYHTMTVQDHSWGPRTDPLVQERLLNLIVSKSLPFWERNQIAYSNFHFSMNTKFAYDRRDAKKEISTECVYFEPNKIIRVKSWKNQSEFSFVISPHGNGLDCHRTWEALCLGCIPIVKTSALDSLYNGLPVWIVQSWTDISLESMSRVVQDFKRKHMAGEFQYERLSLDYWMDRIRNV